MSKIMKVMVLRISKMPRGRGGAGVWRCGRNVTILGSVRRGGAEGRGEGLFEMRAGGFMNLMLSLFEAYA